MKKQDYLSAYMKDLPGEEPSADFTRLVMERVRIEVVKSPSVYEPLINGTLWIKIFAGIVLSFLGAVLLSTYFPGNGNEALIASFHQINLAALLKPFQLLSNALNGLSLNFFLGVAAIFLLLFADQLYSRVTDRRT